MKTDHSSNFESIITSKSCNILYFTPSLFTLLCPFVLWAVLPVFFLNFAFTRYFTVWGLWISVSCLSAQSAAETCHPLLTHSNALPRQDDETTGNVLFTKAPQLSLSSLSSVVGGVRSETWRSKVYLYTSKTQLIPK